MDTSYLPDTGPGSVVTGVATQIPTDTTGLSSNISTKQKGQNIFGIFDRIFGGQ